MTHNRILTAGAAAAVLLAGAAGAAFAHPHAEGEGEGKKKVERIVVIGDGTGGDHHGKPGKHKVRRVEIHGAGGDHHGKPGGHKLRRFEIHGDGAAHCDGAEKIVDEVAAEGGRKTKVIVCAKGAPTAATAQHLEEALARITANDELSDEQKARISTALRSAIDRARSAR